MIKKLVKVVFGTQYDRVTVSGQASDDAGLATGRCVARVALGARADAT